MNYTENYHLPQWVKSDRILMEDFNQAMEKIDAGLGAVRTASAEKPYVIGSYTGTLRKMEIETGFRPSFLIIFAIYTGNEVKDEHGMIPGMASCFTGDDPANTVKFTSTGFTITGDVLNYPSINWRTYQYTYIAFR